MTSLVSLLLIFMIPILKHKFSIFPFYIMIYEWCELVHTVSNERMTPDYCAIECMLKVSITVGTTLSEHLCAS